MWWWSWVLQEKADSSEADVLCGPQRGDRRVWAARDRKKEGLYAALGK